jgi:hypothetical protein
MERLTYKSLMGDYGSTKEYPTHIHEIQTLRNALGKYEDLGMTPEEIKQMKDRFSEASIQQLLSNFRKSGTTDVHN